MPFGILLTCVFGTGPPVLAVASSSHARVRLAGGAETFGAGYVDHGNTARADQSTYGYLVGGGLASRADQDQGFGSECPTNHRRQLRHGVASPSKDGSRRESRRTKLSGDVEFDETYVGGIELGAGGRSRGKKAPVAVVCEVVSPKAMGRIRLARLPDASALAIADFLQRNVEPGSVLLCDDWASYGPVISELGARGLHYTAKTTTLSKTETGAHLVHPHVHRVASLLKCWLLVRGPQRSVPPAM